MAKSAQYHCKLRQQTHSFSLKTMIIQSIEVIIICVFILKLPPNVGYCCSYGLAKIDAAMMGFRAKIC